MRIPLIFLALCLATRAGAFHPWRPEVTIPVEETPDAERRTLSAEEQKKFAEAFERGQRLLDLGQYEKARSLLERAIELDPDSAPARAAHARTLLTLGYLTWNRALVSRALVDVRQALWLKPGDTSISELETLLVNLEQRMERIAPRAKERKSGG